MGAFLTGMLARNSANGNLALNLKDYVKDTAFQPLVLEQLKAITLTLLLAVVGTTVIAYAVKMVLGLRPSEDVEVGGLDIAEHGEEGYHSEGYSWGRPGLAVEQEATPAAASVPGMGRKPAT